MIRRVGDDDNEMTFLYEKRRSLKAEDDARSHRSGGGWFTSGYGTSRMVPRALSGKQSPDHKDLTGGSVRFQVVVWYIGPIDVVLGLVTMKFRITIFWNAPSQKEHEEMSTSGYGNYDAKNKKVWTMHGRQRAYQKELPEIIDNSNLVYVPPVSILNALSFKVEGDPEICLINEKEKTFKWTCMYTARLIQDHLRVDSFPHDEHEVKIKLGIMKHRQKGKRWDSRKWTVGLATEKDSQNTIRIPHGLIVDHVQIPEFICNRDRIRFDLCRLTKFGVEGGSRVFDESESQGQDEYLEVSIPAKRNSGYYDRNIIPLLAMLNGIGISTLTLHALEFGSRAEVILAIAFVAMGLRLSVDSKLPQVGYQIKLQRIMNRFFYTLLFMHVESSFVYTCIKHWGYNYATTRLVNIATMVACAVYTLIQLLDYYNDVFQR